MKKLTMFGIVFAAACAWAVDLPDPVIWWTMDAVEDSKVKDVTGNGWDLTGLGSGTHVTNLAAKGNALWFDGTTDSWANRSNQPLLTSRTLSFWIWRNEYPGDCRAYAPTAEDKRQAGMPSIFSNLSALNIRSNNNMVDETKPLLGVSSRDLVSWYGSGGGLGGYYFSLNNYPTFMLGAWTHICYSIDVKSAVLDANGTQSVHTFDAKVYINGTPCIVVTDGVTTNGSSSTALWVGNLSSRLRPFCGALDEVRVFDSALTAEQVAAEYARISACHARLVARWPLDTFSERDDGGSYTSPVTAGFMAGLGDGYDMTFNDHTCVTNGPAGTTAVHFDGTATTRGTVASIPYKLEDFTVACWVHMPTNANIIRIAGQGNNFPRLFTLGGNVIDIHFQRGDSNRTVQYTVPGCGGNVKTFGVTCLPKGLWQHLAFAYRSVLDPATGVRTGTQFEAWLNGKRMMVDTDITWTAVNRDLPFTVGNASHSGNATRVLEGDVRDIHIFNGALSADDIEALYRGAAAVDAGTDFTVNGTDATLRGTVAADGNSVAAAYAGEVAWTQVSGPATATFARAGNPVTEVTLPAEGVYVFRLSTTTRVGDTHADTVTVTRDDAAPATAVQAWDPTAELAMHASLTNGLIIHYPVPASTNEMLCVWEAVSGTRKIGGMNWTTARLDTGVRGYAMRAQGKSGSFNTSTVFTETQHEASGNWPPIEEWRTVAAWIFRDGNDETPWYAAPWFSVPYTLNLCYGKFMGYSDWKESDRDGFTIQQFGMSGVQSRMHYNMPYSISNRWTHVCAVVNRHDTTKSRFYLDGVELLAAEVSSGVYSNDESKFKSSYSNYVGQALGGRVQGSNNPIYIGSLPANTGNGTMTSAVSNVTTHAVAYRVFPGAIDDVRVYNRPLSADEIAYLAEHPDVDGNLAPYIGDVGTGNVTMSSRKARAFAPETVDDGLPVGSPVTYEWEVLTGDPADVVFADKTAAATQVMVTKVGNYSFRLKATDGERVTYGRTIFCEVLQAGTMIILK